MAVLLLIDFLLYVFILIKCFKIQKDTPFYFNYLIISILLNIVYEILIFSQLYFPILTPLQYEIKEYFLLFQFTYSLLYFSKYNLFYNKVFEKIFIFICYFFNFLFLIISWAHFFYIPGFHIMAALNIFEKYGMAFFFLVPFLMYIFPTIMQKKFNARFKRLVFFFVLNSFLITMQLMTTQASPVIYYLNVIGCILYNGYLFRFISKYKGRYLND
jgi:hypothetical protein